MAGYTVMFSDEHQMAMAIVGTTWCVGPEQVNEFRDFLEKKLGLKMPPNGQLFKYDDPDYKPLIEWLKDNGLSIRALESMSSKHIVSEEDTSNLIKCLGKDAVGVIDNEE